MPFPVPGPQGCRAGWKLHTANPDGQRLPFCEVCGLRSLRLSPRDPAPPPWPAACSQGPGLCSYLGGGRRRGGGMALNVATNTKKSNGLRSLKINFLEITLSFVFVSLIKIYLGKKAPHKLTQTQEQIS